MNQLEKFHGTLTLTFLAVASVSFSSALRLACEPHPHRPPATPCVPSRAPACQHLEHRLAPKCRPTSPPECRPEHWPNSIQHHRPSTAQAPSDITALALPTASTCRLRPARVDDPVPSRPTSSSSRRLRPIHTELA
jgi:hypothetical protein